MEFGKQDENGFLSSVSILMHLPREYDAPGIERKKQQRIKAFLISKATIVIQFAIEVLNTDL